MTVIAAEMVPRALKDASLGASLGGGLLSLILVHSLQFHLRSVRSSKVQHKPPSRRKSQDHFTSSTSSLAHSNLHSLEDGVTMLMLQARTLWLCHQHVSVSNLYT